MACQLLFVGGNGATCVECDCLKSILCTKAGFRVLLRTEIISKGHTAFVTYFLLVRLLCTAAVKLNLWHKFLLDKLIVPQLVKNYPFSPSDGRWMFSPCSQQPTNCPHIDLDSSSPPPTQIYVSNEF